MNKKPHIAVVGAANVDIIATPHANYVPNDCPGSIAMSYGGVSRNIAHNLTLMGCDVSLITAFGDDELAAGLKHDCERIGIDVQHSAIIPGATSSMYVCVNDEHGEMVSAVAAMDILEGITPEFISSLIDMLNSCDAVVLDACLPTDTIAYILDNCNVPIFADSVSPAKSHRIFNALSPTRSIHTLKMNRAEAQEVIKKRITDNADMDAVAEVLHQKGVKRVFITLGAQGCYYHDADGGIHLPCEKVEVVNTCGAGDAFLAGAALAFLKGLDNESTIKCALRAAALTVQCNEAVNPEINEKYVLCE